MTVFLSLKKPSRRRPVRKRPGETVGKLCVEFIYWGLTRYIYTIYTIACVVLEAPEGVPSTNGFNELRPFNMNGTQVLSHFFLIAAQVQEKTDIKTAYYFSSYARRRKGFLRE